MDYHLRDHLSFGAVGSNIVLLDLAADRYFQLHGAESALLTDAVRRTADLSGCEVLAAQGVLSRGPGAAIAPVVAPAAATSAVEETGPQIKVGWAEVARVRLGAAWSLRRRGLHATIGHWRHQKAKFSGCGANADEACAIARGYASARMLLPAARLCVPDSLALLRCLWNRGVGADLYFGVRLDPFAAHAWVQQGQTILSDSLGTVAEYRAVFRL